jgi:hypothetical protein
VAIYGINVWENVSVDPARFLADRGISYPQLGGAVEAAAMAFKVSYLPTTFVIGPNGDLLLAAPGGLADAGESTRQAIKKGLAQLAE